MPSDPGQDAGPTPPAGGRTGYVLKVYPRFSETFVVSELRALEATGADLEVVSLRPPTDGRFHAELAQVRAPVTYLTHPLRRAVDLWALLASARSRLPRLTDALPDLLDVPVSDAAQAVELALLVQDRGLDHLHAHFGSVATTVARLAARLTGIPYTFTAHAKDIYWEGVEGEDLRRKLRDAAATVTVSDYNLDHLRAAFGQDADRVVRVYNGLDLARFRPSDPSDRPARIVAVGRLVEKKGFDVLVDACALLAARGRPVDAVVVGGGALEGELRARVAERALTGAVRLLGPLPQDDVRRVVADSAVLAAPCVIGADGNRDGMPTVVLEAMALGTPVVATPVTGMPEAVREGETGLLVPERDAPALADALARLLDDGALRRRLATAARTLVEAEFSSARQARQLATLFDRVRTDAAVAHPEGAGRAA